MVDRVSLIGETKQEGDLEVPVVGHEISGRAQWSHSNRVLTIDKSPRHHTAQSLHPGLFTSAIALANQGSPASVFWSPSPFCTLPTLPNPTQQLLTDIIFSSFHSSTREPTAKPGPGASLPPLLASQHTPTAISRYCLYPVEHARWLAAPRVWRAPPR